VSHFNHLEIFTIGSVALVAYHAGSIPFGVILLRSFGRPDPRTMGSGNIGATNVTRVGGKALGAATLALDVLKGFVPAILLDELGPWGALAGLAAVVGHCYPVWLRFEGGKGVATFLGAALATTWPVGPIAFLAAWILVAVVTRFASVASLAACWLTPVAVVVAARISSRSPGEGIEYRLSERGPAEAFALFLAAILVTWRHRSNLGRLADGQEPRMGAKTTAAA
jgi:glycerol-3-phosphate acyltransferase PlsY